jgi:uncharacterized protein YqhQ
MEIQIKRIQASLLELEIVKEFTEPADAVQPIAIEEPSNEEVTKAINQFNNLFKK